MKTLSCIGLPDPQSIKVIQNLMEKVSSECQSVNSLGFKPHFTLRGWFQIENQNVEKLHQTLNTLSKNTSPIKLQCQRYGFYPWKIIYLDVEPNEELQVLHERTMQEIQKLRTDWVPEALNTSPHFSGKQKEYVNKYGYQFSFEFFSPHFTLAGTDIQDSTFNTVKKKLSRKTEKIEFRLEKISLMDKNLDNKIVKTFSLSG